MGYVKVSGSKAFLGGKPSRNRPGYGSKQSQAKKMRAVRRFLAQQQAANKPTDSA